MLRRIAMVCWLLIGSVGVASADAAKDCEKLSGDAAIRACDEAIRDNPRSAAMYSNRGVAYKVKGDIDRAIVD